MGRSGSNVRIQIAPQVGRALVLFLRLILIIVLTVQQAVPPGMGLMTPSDRMPISVTNVSLGSATDSEKTATPSSGMAVGCIDRPGCLPVIAIRLRSSTTLGWTLAIYSLPSVALSGRSVNPELRPPILPA